MRESIEPGKEIRGRKNNSPSCLRPLPLTLLERLGYPNIAEHYRAKVIRLTETLAEPEPNGEAREDIRALIGEVVITPGEKRGESHATLVQRS
jgi:hypothetical protein